MHEADPALDGGDAAGGSAGLAELIEDHGECLIADFRSHYGLNLVDMLRPGSGYSPRLVLVYARQLPVESRTVAAIRGGHQFDGWGFDRYLFASLIDAVNMTTHAVVASNSGKKKPKPPKPMQRPSKNGPKKDDMSNPFRQQLMAARKAQGG